MIFTKEHQKKLLDEYVTNNPSATAKEMIAYMLGMEKGLSKDKLEKFVQSLSADIDSERKQNIPGVNAQSIAIKSKVLKKAYAILKQ